MGLLFRKRIKIAKGIHLNASKSGLGINIGVPGANVTLNKKGVTANYGIPGTGIYGRETISRKTNPQNQTYKKSDSEIINENPTRFLILFVFFFLGVAIPLFFGGSWWFLLIMPVLGVIIAIIQSTPNSSPKEDGNIVVKSKPDECTWIYIDAFKKKYKDVLWENLSNDLQKYYDQGHNRIYITTSTIENLDKLLKEKESDIELKKTQTENKNWESSQNAFFEMKQNGAVAEANDDTSSAIRHYEDLLAFAYADERLIPNNYTSVMERLVILYSKTKQYGKEVEMIQSIINNPPNNTVKQKYELRLPKALRRLNKTTPQNHQKER